MEAGQYDVDELVPLLYGRIARCCEGGSVSLDAGDPRRLADGLSGVLRRASLGGLA
jgi:hypothetical protein